MHLYLLSDVRLRDVCAVETMAIEIQQLCQTQIQQSRCLIVRIDCLHLGVWEQSDECYICTTASSLLQPSH